MLIVFELERGCGYIKMKEFTSDKVTNMYGEDLRVVASLPAQELEEAQNLVNNSHSNPGVVVLPSRRLLYPKVEGLGPTTDVNSVGK